MSSRVKFMFAFGLGTALVVGGLTALVAPWWVAGPVALVAGAGGFLLAPRSAQAIAAHEHPQLSEAAQNVSEADWQAGSELTDEDWA